MGEEKMSNYGKSVSIDLHNCDPSLFNRRDLRKFVKALCAEIDMVAAKLVWWDYGADDEEKAKAPAHLKGVSMVQFIETSTIVVHTLDDLRAIYFDIFSCKDFDSDKVIKFVENYFHGKCVNSQSMERK